MKKGQGNKIAGGNPSRGRAKNDYYATHPDSTKALISVEEIIYPVLEPACGEGHIVNLLDNRFVVDACDIDFKGCGTLADIDFLDEESFGKYFPEKKWSNTLQKNVDGRDWNTIITNPPFNLFQEFVEKSLKLAKKKVIMFGKLQALEGQKRGSFMQNSPLKTVYVFKKRQQPLRNGSDVDELTGKKMASSTMAFAWFVWEIGYEGEPTIKWL